LTLTLKSLSEQSVEHGAAVFAERRRHVIVHLEPVRNVYVKPLRQHLLSARCKYAHKHRL